MTQIFSESAPRAIGPYAHAVKAGNFLYCSGQTPLNPQTMIVESSGIADQTSRVMENLRLVLATENLTLKDVVKTTVFLSDMRLFGEMNEVYATAFESHRPARSTVAVNGLPYDALIEIECIAVYKDEGVGL